MKILSLLCCLVSLIVLSGCSELGSLSGGFSSSNEGGDVASTIQFQNYKFRTGAGFKATQLGAVGLVRRSGHNVFEIKAIPEISNLALERTASFTKSTKSKMELLGNLSMDELKGIMELGADGNMDRSKTESGIFTIYYVANTKDLVDQLNQPKNKELREYLARSRNTRIITAIVKVNSHSLILKKSKKLNGHVAVMPEVDPDKLAAFQNEGTAVASTANNESKSVEVEDTDRTLPSGLTIADGGTYAYEYSRIIWNVEGGKIVDLLADRPSGLFSYSDSNDHQYQGVTSDPHKVKSWDN